MFETMTVLLIPKFDRQAVEKTEIRITAVGTIVYY